MGTTRSTSGTRDNVALTAPLAMFLLASFVLDKGIPQPRDYTSPVTPLDREILVRIDPDDLDAWVAAGLRISDSSTRPIRDGAGERIEWTAFVPTAMGEVRIALVAYRVAERPVLAVAR